jgi:predicted dehydrogenase
VVTVPRMIRGLKRQGTNLVKIAVVGYGNMGKRHVDSLLALGNTDVVIIRRNPQGPVSTAHKGIPVLGSLTDALDQGVDAVVISNVTSAHAESLELAMERDLPVLLEKPVADDSDTLTRLFKLSGTSNSKVLVGYDIRFSGALEQLQVLIESGALGEIAFANLDAGGYLPDWRPGLDYRQLYSGQRNLGGGVVLDLVHELDSMLALFGEPNSVTGVIGRKGNLDIDVEDVAQLTFDYDPGPIVGIRLDYLKRPFTRSYTLVGTDATAVWNEQAGTIVLYEDGTGNGRVVWDAQMKNTFETEMSHFLEVVSGRSEPLVSLQMGITSARLALAARWSSEQGQKLDLEIILQ